MSTSLGKRKRLLPAQQNQLRQVLVEQIDLEIALKKRLLAFTNAQLEWAHILRTSVTGADDTTSVTTYPPNAFRDAALATYEAMEEPCRFIISGLDRPFSRHVNGGTGGREEIRAAEAPRTRKRATLGLVPASGTGPLLFEDKSSTIPVTLKLVCSDCSRSDFPTMQGFLNHCRLAHSRNYGTHDECIQACGVIVKNDEKEVLLAAGAEIKTIRLLSLKRIFEGAVGLRQVDSDGATKSQLVQESPQVSTHLTQTLGLHEDTPTLAPFLGKEVKKRVIHVYDESEAIDIVEMDNNTPLKPRLPWVTKRRHTRSPEGGISINMAALAIETMGEVKGPQHVLNGMRDQGSRFHITRRILISDRSLYLAPTKRPSDPDTTSHTHRWQISISSPSYEQHISTFLLHLTIVCVTQPPVFESPIIVSEPPFIACSTTDRPFLARLTLTWVGDQNSDYSVEHWVDLDQSKAARPVLGEEQMLDVELDRHTSFLPVSTAVPTVPWTGEGDSGRGNISMNPALDRPMSGIEIGSIASEPPHIQLLKSIVPQFPITLQDLGSRQSSKVSYTVYPSPAKLLNVVVGRRKAIEWSRAFAIRSAYDSLIASMPSSDDYVYLTTADVYRWLESEGLYPRPRAKVQPPVKSESSQPSSIPDSEVKVEPSFCAVCGVDVRFHSPGVLLNPGGEHPREPPCFHCPAELERHQAPLIHWSLLIAPIRNPPSSLLSDQTQQYISQSTPRDMVSSAHPHLTRLVRQEVASLNLSMFGAHLASDGYEISIDQSRAELERTLGPYSIIGIVLEKVIRDLVGSALQVARENQGRTKSPAGGALGVGLMSLLTRTHVLQGLLKGAEMGGTRQALLQCLARAGTMLETAHNSGGGVAIV